jgi:DNA-binding Xre family transcriptional regulator/DNA-binding Lrp family transcriptional regulator
MSNIFLFDSLRAHLKARGLTYKQLADGICISEPTVKRIFASNDCSLGRLHEICHFLHLELDDLVKSTPKRRKLMDQLTIRQETELVENKKLLMIAICAMNLWTFEDMLSHLNISQTECIALLHRLDKIGFVEMQAHNQYRLLVAKDFTWLVDGPIMRLVKGVSDDFFNHRFEAPGEVLKIINVRVSPRARESLKARLEQIAQEYADQVVADSHLPLNERSPLSICIAVRTWVPEFLCDLLRLEPPLTGADKAYKNSKVSKTNTLPTPW